MALGQTDRDDVSIGTPPAKKKQRDVGGRAGRRASKVGSLMFVIRRIQAETVHAQAPGSWLGGRVGVRVGVGVGVGEKARGRSMGGWMARRLDWVGGMA